MSTSIPLTSSGSLYGKGIFSTISVRALTPFLWEKHWRRLTQNAKILGIDLAGFSETTVRGALREVIDGSHIADGRVRITFYDNRPSEIWPSKDDCGEHTTMSIIVGDRRPVPRPFRCFVSAHMINSSSPLAGVKSCNYLENILALDNAKDHAFDEAIRLNENGVVTSAWMANVFWLKDGRLFTPSLSTGCLPGTTREFVLENVNCEEVEAGVGAIESADAVFLTSAGLGVAAVDDFNGRPFSKNDHAILHLIDNHR